MGALLLFLLALHFQVITLVGIAGVLLWAAADRARPRLTSAQMALTVVGVAVIGLVALGAIARGAFANQLALFNYVDQWAAANRHNVRYYHDIFLDQYATIWTIFPLLVILAIYRNGRAATLLSRAVRRSRSWCTRSRRGKPSGICSR